MKPFSIVDLHCDTLMELYLQHTDLRSWQGHINLEKLQKGGSLLQCLAVFIPTHGTAERRGIKDTPYEYFNNVADIFDREMEANKDVIRPARCMADILKNLHDNKISGMLTIEDGVAVDGKIERVKEFYDRGVRMMSLTWNFENSIAFPNSDDPEKHMLGLKPFGLEVIAEMDRLGMIIDTSHLNEGGFWDIVKYGKKPFIASHSCARALCNHRRNLTDEQLKALGEKGGICGVNFYNNFLKTDDTASTIDDLLRHMHHIADKAGMDTVALGSDFDGIGCDLEFKDFSGMAQIADAVAKEFGADNCDKITHGNALRVFQDVIG